VSHADDGQSVGDARRAAALFQQQLAEHDRQADHRYRIAAPEAADETRGEHAVQSA